MARQLPRRLVAHVLPRFGQRTIGRVDIVGGAKMPGVFLAIKSDRRAAVGRVREQLDANEVGLCLRATASSTPGEVELNRLVFSKLYFHCNKDYSTSNARRQNERDFEDAEIKWGLSVADVRKHVRDFENGSPCHARHERSKNGICKNAKNRVPLLHPMLNCV